MTEKGFGMTTIVAEDNSLLGVFTDGDLRRSGRSAKLISPAPLWQTSCRPTPKPSAAVFLAAEALNIMENATITALIVEDENHHPIGVLHMHDILRAGVV